MRPVVISLIATLFVVAASQQTPASLVVPTSGMVITSSVRLRSGTYRLPSTADQPALTIRGSNLTVDLTGVTLEGGDPLADPDGYVGTGIFVDGGNDITVTGLGDASPESAARTKAGAIRGYKVGVLARGADHLHLTGLDVSDNWKPRLWSGIEKESLVDWLDFHDNEHDQWLRDGAAVYLADCRDCEVDHTRAVQGMNGLLLVRSVHDKVWNNTFSWMSGLGMGLYRTTDSTIMHNRLDWDVRGYSNGFYYRGQDSAALLMYEQSSRNTIAYNSATHGGDGLFLWAGQSTMDTGQGGANDNIVAANDFSSAVANGIEATFSRNTFLKNRIEDCWHGIWGGYSFDSKIVDNAFAANTEGVSIEHGQHIDIVGNTFTKDGTAIHLWANPNTDPTWGYGKVRDIASHGDVVALNTFDGNKTAIDVQQTSDLRVDHNTFTGVATPLKQGPDVTDLAFAPPDAPASPPNPADVAARAIELPAPLPGGMDAMLAPDALRGRATIIVDEWGPYDYRSPKLWPAGKPTDRPLKLRVLGPPGRWRLKSIRGGALDVSAGVVPGDVTVTTKGRNTDLDVELEYTGGEVVTSRGVTVQAGQPVAFSYTQFDPAVDWVVKFWTYDQWSDPVGDPPAFVKKTSGTPRQIVHAPHLSYLTAGALVPGVSASDVALVATGAVDLPAGPCFLDVISDDGVRVWMDGHLIIDDWSIHESKVDTAPLLGGRHQLRVEYFQATGWEELQVRFRKQAQ